ncbi:MAG: hypothetical protein QM778_19580 [Myxococcales bacterium]
MGALVLLAEPSCAHMKTGGAREVGKNKHGRSVSEAELQQELQRFAGQFFDRSAWAMEKVYAELDADKQFLLMKRWLLYDSSMLDIVSGKSPLVNLLDLLVFMELTRSKFESYWMPDVFGPPSEPVLAALKRSEAEIWGLGEELLSPAQVTRLHGLIAQWQAENPGQERVEMVRLAEFSRTAGTQATEQHADAGLLGGVQSVTRTADEAVLLGERAMFFAQRAPFLIRIQARIGAAEVTQDGVRQLAGQAKLLDRTEELLVRTSAIIGQSADLLERTGKLEPLVRELTQLTQNATVATQEVRLLNTSLTPLADRLSPLLASRVNSQGQEVTAIESVLASSNQLSQRSYDLVKEVQNLVPEGRGDQRLGVVRAELDRGLRRLMGYLALVGAAWAVFFWGGYYLVKRQLNDRQAGTPGSPRGHHPPPGARPSSAG